MANQHHNESRIAKGGTKAAPQSGQGSNQSNAILHKSGHGSEHEAQRVRDAHTNSAHAGEGTLAAAGRHATAPASQGVQASEESAVDDGEFAEHASTRGLDSEPDRAGHASHNSTQPSQSDK